MYRKYSLKKLSTMIKAECDKKMGKPESTYIRLSKGPKGRIDIFLPMKRLLIKKGNIQ